MLEHMPDDHLIEVGSRISGFLQIFSKANDGPAIDASRRGGTYLKAVSLEPALSECRKQHAAAAADVEDPRADFQPARERSDVTRSHESHQPLDQRHKFGPSQAVVAGRIELRDDLARRPRMQTAQSTARTVDNPKVQAREAVTGSGPFSTAN